MVDPQKTTLALYDYVRGASVMADYIVQLVVSTTPDVEPKELQGILNLPDVAMHLADVIGAALTLPRVPAGKKYPKAGTFAVGSVTVTKK